MVVTVTLVQTPACHFCEDARTALAEFGRTHDVRVEVVAADSEPGRALVGQHRPGMFPLILVDGAFFGIGRLSRGRLRALLSARAGTGVPS
jgi:hypothetical protein